MCKRIFRTLLTFALTLAAMLAAYAAISGMWLFGVPNAKNVVEVTITSTEHPAETIVSSDAECIERTVKLTGFLKYRLFTAAQEDDTPIVTIVWTLRDGSVCEISASRETVWRRGRALPLKDEAFFINLADGIFFNEQ